MENPPEIPPAAETPTTETPAGEGFLERWERAKAETQQMIAAGLGEYKGPHKQGYYNGEGAPGQADAYDGAYQK